MRIPIKLYLKDVAILLAVGIPVAVGPLYLGAWILHVARAWWVWPTEIVLGGLCAAGASLIGLVVRQAIDGNINWTV